MDFNVLDEVRAVADSAEREAALRTIGALLALYPTAPYLFLIADAEPPGATVVTPMTNASSGHVFWLLSVAAQSMMGGQHG